MKNVILIFVFLLASIPAMAQKRSDFQGPKYKNYKYWKYDTKPMKIYVGSAKKNLTGPKFKNYKPGEIEVDTADKKVLMKSRRPKVTGPKYKNYKIGQHTK